MAIQTEDSEFPKALSAKLNLDAPCAIRLPEERGMRGECRRCGADQGQPCREHPEMI